MNTTHRSRFPKTIRYGQSNNEPLNHQMKGPRVNPSQASPQHRVACPYDHMNNEYQAADGHLPDEITHSVLRIPSRIIYAEVDSPDPRRDHTIR